MYELKTVLPQFDIKLPTCMYSMKNVALATGACAGTQSTGSAAAATREYALSGEITTATPTPSVCSTSLSKCACVLDLDKLGAQIQRLLKSSPDADTIIFRQDKVLQQLNELKNQLAGIRSTLGLCQKGPQHTGLHIVAESERKRKPLPDIVINGHPNFIPYALLALKNAWKDSFTINVRIFTHSTMADIGEEAREFEKKLAQVPVNASVEPKINITLIWKNCEHTEMICSPTMYVPIYGEVNIIRYLGRVGPADYRYEESPLCNEIDSVLDTCYQLLRCTKPKDKAGLIRLLNQRLQKQLYFGGGQMSIADIGVHSSLKRMPSIADKDLTPALIEWRKRVHLVTQI